MSTRSTTFAFIGQDKFSKVADGVQRKASGMGTKLGKVGVVAGKAMAVGFAAAGAAAVGAGIALGHMAKAAMEDEAAQKRLALGLRNTTGATDAAVAGVEKWITAQGEALGVADDQLRPALSRLARSTESVAEAQRLASLAMDASAGTGKSLEAVSAALAKAHDGNVGALARLGIKTKDASGKTLKFDEIVKNMSKTFKGQAAAGANTLEGRMGRLRLMFDETKESVGAKLLPVVEKLTGWVLNKGIPAFKSFMDGTLKPLAQKIIPVLREYWGKLRAAFEDSRPGLERIAGVAKLLGQMFVEHVIPAMGKVAGIVVPLVIKAIGKLGEILPPIIVAMLRFAENVINTWKAIFTAVTGAVSGVLSAMGHLPGKAGEMARDAKKGFDSFRDEYTATLDGLQAGLTETADGISAFNAKAKVKANIDDLTSKLATARRELKDPSLTAERRAQLNADITKLVAKRKAATAELAKLKDRVVNVDIRARVEADVRFNRWNTTTGGQGGVGPAGDAGAGLMQATRGVGHPGAKFGQWGPAWSWNRRNGRGQHDGADITGTGSGTPVYATRAGRIVGTGNSGWAGKHVIWEANGTRFIYAHLSSISRTNGYVGPGMPLGKTGSTGNSSGPHLHVQASRAGRYVDPNLHLWRGGQFVARGSAQGTAFVAGDRGRPERVTVEPLSSVRQSQQPLVVQFVLDGRVIQQSVVRYEQSTGRPILTAGAA